MNATAVLPASVAMTFTGNAATISDSGAAGGFSDTLGAMVTSGQQCNMNSAVRMESDNADMQAGEILSDLTELEQNTQELKELLKTAELAGYMQGAMAQYSADIPQVDNAELMLILTGNEGAEVVKTEIAAGVADLTDNAVKMTDFVASGTEAEEILQNSKIVTENTLKNDFADNVKTAETVIDESKASTVDEKNIVDVPTSENVTEKSRASDDSVKVPFNETGTDVKAEPETTQQNVNVSLTKDVQVRSYERTTDDPDVTVTQEATAEAESAPVIAYAKRNIEVKSDELKEITKGNEIARSDSDLEAQQKVTDKNAVNDMSARSADVFARTESRSDGDEQAAHTVRVPISDMASFVSEHAPKANGKSTLTVVLTPETLGKITVRMVNESGKLTVEILTETQAAKELLQAKSEQLAYALKNDDVELTSYKVETTQAELFQRDFDGSSKNPYRQQSGGHQNNDTDDFDSLLGEIQTMD